MTTLQAIKRGMITSIGYLSLLVSYIVLFVLTVLFDINFHTFIFQFGIINTALLVSHVFTMVWREKNYSYRAEITEMQRTKNEAELQEIHRLVNTINNNINYIKTKL